jgi:hypothetical protein
MDLEEIEFFLMECEWREDEDEEEVESSIRSWRQQTQHSQSLAISDTQMLLLMWGQNPSFYHFFKSFFFLFHLFIWKVYFILFLLKIYSTLIFLFYFSLKKI